MKIVDRATFLAMPGGTVFVRDSYDQAVSIKLCNYDEISDFGCRDIGDVEDEGDTASLDLTSWYRDAEQDYDRFFVFEKSDIESMIGVLQEALEDLGDAS